MRDGYFAPPNSDLPAGAREIGEPRTLCLEFGRYFVRQDSETFATSQSNHKCAKEKLLDIWVWRPEDLESGQLESCCRYREAVLPRDVRPEWND